VRDELARDAARLEVLLEEDRCGGLAARRIGRVDADKVAQRLVAQKRSASVSGMARAYDSA
jgi:hypothetical protein